jgi:hypothetical protein
MHKRKIQLESLYDIVVFSHLLVNTKLWGLGFLGHFFLLCVNIITKTKNQKKNRGQVVKSWFKINQLCVGQVLFLIVVRTALTENTIEDVSPCFLHKAFSAVANYTFLRLPRPPENQHHRPIYSVLLIARLGLAVT